MKILNSNQEQQAVSNTVNWEERELLAYPEDAPILEQLKSYVPPKKQTFTKAEIECFQKHYAQCGHKPTTCRKFDITLQQLNGVLNHV